MYFYNKLNLAVWWGKMEGKRPLGTARLTWKGNTKTDLKEISLEDMH